MHKIFPDRAQLLVRFDDLDKPERRSAAIQGQQHETNALKKIARQSDQT
jgi:hypothetical protein